MNNKLKILIPILLFSLIAAIVAGAVLLNNSNEDTNQEDNTEAQTEVTYTSINSDELNEMLQNKDFKLIDVHIPEQQHIKGTDAFIPYNNIDQIVDYLGDDKDQKVVLYCRSGSMSKDAAKKLVDLGYTNIYDLENGIIEWKSKGYELEN